MNDYDRFYEPFVDISTEKEAVAVHPQFGIAFTLLLLITVITVITCILIIRRVDHMECSNKTVK